jgi:hypothetical protein
MDERARRIGENEILYRTVNEKIEGLNATFGTLTQSMTVVCECGDAGCAEQIDLAVPDYERIRADSALFVIVPGHEYPDVEEIVEETDTYAIVRKDPGGPEELAAANDPREG